jgi:hypothetical protein
MSTPITDEQLLLKCRLLIAEKLLWQPAAEWRNGQLSELSAKILEASGVGLSTATLKRLFVDEGPPAPPDRSSLNAIANFLGYESWEPFKAEHRLRASVLGALMSKESDRAKLRSMKPFYVGVVLVAIIVLCAFLFLKK